MILLKSKQDTGLMIEVLYMIFEQKYVLGSDPVFKCILLFTIILKLSYILLCIIENNNCSGKTSYTLHTARQQMESSC